VVDGSIEADGGSVGEDGGGGSGGSLYIKASRIKGNGQISASGGTGRGGGSGGRIAINCLRLDGVTVSIHGWVSLSLLLLQVSGSLFACSEICFDGMEL
jgi:hypothetical protein